MKTVQLDIDVRHHNLMKIFFEANELFELGFTLEIVDREYDTPMTITSPDGIQRTYSFSQTKKVLEYTYDDENEYQVSKLVDLSLKHLGFSNMLHDFLNKCGVSAHGI